MGKNLKGKELGTGLSQKKNGKYFARTRVGGVYKGQYFTNLQEAKAWLKEVNMSTTRGVARAGSNITLNAWFKYWIDNVKRGNITKKTLNSYVDLYEKNVKEVIGDCKIRDLKPIHCQSVFNIMRDKKFSDVYIKKTRAVLHDCFEEAVCNDLIEKNPINRNVNAKGLPPKEKYIMTVDEQDKFMNYIKKNCHYKEFAFILQTGLRYAELTGLKWEDVDFEKKVINIKRSADLDRDINEFVEKPPKTKAGYRIIPLTKLALEILEDQKKLRTTSMVNIKYKDYVFLNRNGRPTEKGTFNKGLKSIMKNLGLPSISIHCLRHTFATRCIEAGMKPKVLQKILGHSKISVTMDLYVHVVPDEIISEFEKFEKSSQKNNGLCLIKTS